MSSNNLSVIVANILAEHEDIKPYEAIDVTFSRARLEEIKKINL